MLELRPGCECCDRDLPPDSETVLRGRCPNCGGELVPRPRRPADKLLKYPASSTRVYKPEGCRG